jgi:hypothetical protein
MRLHLPVQRVQLAPSARLLHGRYRSGDAIGERRTVRWSSSPLWKRGAEPVGAVIHRPAGHSGTRRIGERSAPAEAVSSPVARPIWRAGANPRARLDLIQAPRTGRRIDSHGAAFPMNAPPTPETDHRASPSRNGRPAHHLWWRDWRARRCIPSPAGRALSRKPFQPPNAARPIRGRAATSGGTPEFRTE